MRLQPDLELPVAEERRVFVQQARGGQFDGKGGHAGDEDGEEQVAFHDWRIIPFEEDEKENREI